MARRSMFSGFIRSAVNQVGRDSGKVISNAIYGDRHSTPIRFLLFYIFAYIHTE